MGYYAAVSLFFFKGAFYFPDMSNSSRYIKWKKDAEQFVQYAWCMCEEKGKLKRICIYIFIKQL